MLRHWSQFVPDMSTDIRGHEALHHHHHVRLTESRRDQEKGGELDSHEEVRLSFGGPGEIKRREVSWTLTKKLDYHLRAQERSRGGRWCWTLKRAQERSREARWSWAQDVGLYFASVVPQQLCYGHCLRDSAPHSS